MEEFKKIYGTKSNYVYDWWNEWTSKRNYEERERSKIIGCKNEPTILQIVRRTFWRVESASPSPVLGIVVYEHVVRNGQDMAVHIAGRRYDNLQQKWRWNMQFNTSWDKDEDRAIWLFRQSH